MPEEIKSDQVAKKEKRIGWSTYVKGFITFVFISWVPFYGYMYLNARLSGIGYQSVFVAIDVWEAIYYFIISATGLFKYIYFGFEYAMYSLGIGMVILITLLIMSCDYELKRKVIVFIAWSKPKVADSLQSDVGFSIAASIFASLLLYLTPIIVSGIFSIIFLFSILGFVNGEQNGRDVLTENKCIYAKPKSSCVRLTINGSQKIGYVDYSNDKSTFFISNDGIYYLGAKGQIKQHKSFTLDLDMKVDSKEKFNAKKWGEDVSSRVGMLKGFWNVKPENVTGRYVLKHLGESDVIFLYDEFPAYKLSEKTDCKVAFPFDWVSNEVVNVVFSGDCKGII